jgi:hypothetical protein
MVYVILGMHKSGTSLVAKTLHESGINMEERFDEQLDYDMGNKHERSSTFQLNLEILRITEETRSIERVDSKDLLSNHDIQRRMTEIIQQCIDTYDDWGFKDPRTCLTYSLWQKWLPSHSILVVYRHPQQVCNHYDARNPYRTWKVLRTWATYNALILKILKETRQRNLILSYERFMQEEEELSRLASFAGHQVSDVRKRGKYRNREYSGSLVGFIDKLLGIFGPGRPLQIWEDLEMMRQQQVEKQ